MIKAMILAAAALTMGTAADAQTMIPGIMWGQNFNLIAIWGVLAGICLVSALFIFSIIKKLNRVS
jgi:hypothetical protein